MSLLMDFEQERDICKSKRRYNIEEANFEAALEYDKLRVYYCMFCHGYHLTSRVTAAPE